MLSLRCPSLLVLSCYNFVEANQDPRHLSDIKRPESQMVHSGCHSCAFFTFHHVFGTVATWQLWSEHCFVNRCKHEKEPDHSSVWLHRGEHDEHNGKGFTLNRWLFRKLPFNCISWAFLLDIFPNSWRITNLQDDRTSFDCFRAQNVYPRMSDVSSVTCTGKLNIADVQVYFSVETLDGNYDDKAEILFWSTRQ